MRFHRQTEIERQLSEMQVLAWCEPEEITAIANAATPIEVEAGKTLTAEGASAREFFLIMSGSATIYRDGEAVGKLAEGQFFGEMAMLADGHRTGTVIADTPMTVEVVDRRDFLGLMEKTPHLSIKILQGVAERLHRADSAETTYLKQSGATD